MTQNSHMKQLGRRSMSSGAALVMVVAFLATSLTGWTQQEQPPDIPDARLFGAEAPAVAGGDRLSLAIASPDYPVTPGDIYAISYLQAGNQVTLTVQVESGYTINLGIFGRINAREMTLAELRPRIEQIIENAYPRSVPTLRVNAVGVFQVTLRGAIPRTTRVSAWGLSRISDVIAGRTGSYTSLRRVTLIREGERRTYDVFRGLEQGDEDQDPLVRPGDTIEFVSRDVVVTVRGQVNEPGQYELVTGEGFGELQRFVGGFTTSADPSRLVVRRQIGRSVEEIALAGVNEAARFQFRSDDVLIVPARVVPRQLVYVEGAVRLDPTVPIDVEVEGVAPLAPMYNRFSVDYTAGDTLYSLLMEIQDEISPFADLPRSYIIRRDEPEPIRVNLREILYREPDAEDVPLRAFDRVVIPMDAPYVVVSGDVTTTGRIPFNPGEDYTYYLRLAGTGAESFREVSEMAQVFNRDGDRVPREAPIEPGFTIHIPTRVPRIVIITGDVPNPGTFAYQPGRGLTHYLRFAGVGARDMPFVRDRTEIYDAEGALLDPGAPIGNDYTIHVDRPLETERDLLADVLPPPPPPDDFVLVTGGVTSPGLIAYVAGQGAGYYIRRAGGVNTDLSASGDFVVTDATGTRRARDGRIAPGDRIEVARDGFIYNFNRYFPVITTGLGFITTIVTLITTLQP